MPIKTTRRGFLQLGAASATALTLGASLASLSGCSRAPSASGFTILRTDDLALLAALAPAVLHGSYPGPLAEQAESKLLSALDALISTLQEYAQSQLLMLFDVLNYAPTRFLLGAPSNDWSTLSTSEINRFLDDWQHSTLALKRMGHSGLIKLMSMCWYSLPDNFLASGYPGMPTRVLSPL